MIHFLISFIFLLLVVLFVFGYTCLFLFFLRYGLRVISEIRRNGFKRRAFVPTWRTSGVSVKGAITIGFICLALTVGLYLYERNRWITPKSSRLNAKQYFVVGMVLMDYRTIGNSFIYPERMIWKPAVWLQQWITHSGLRLIPENDGERAIWKYHFVLAPYINRIHNPRTEENHSLISTCEYVLKMLATSKIADQGLNY